MWIHQAGVLSLAAIFDYLIGDPWGWIHPVQVMGWVIQSGTQLILKFCSRKWQRRLAGMILGLGLIVGSGSVTWLLIYFVSQVNHFLGIILEIIFLASCFAGRSLRLASLDVLNPLVVGKIEVARAKLSQYVGRDTAHLSESEILRAVLETVAENTTDGVTSPLFYAILGSFLPMIGAVPLTFAYKAASTLDSMVGYRQEPYTDLGWFSAKLEDYLTCFPCRLTVLTLALISCQPQQVLSLCYRDARKDPSPNSGWSECVYATILRVQLGGVNSYQGVIQEKPLLGDDLEPITPDKIYQALGLTRLCFLMGLGIAVIGLILMSL
jgi:adenosylcobinamide-phosphate synthase